jgi:hypothetical protein
LWAFPLKPLALLGGQPKAWDARLTDAALLPGHSRFGFSRSAAGSSPRSFSALGGHRQGLVGDIAKKRGGNMLDVDMLKLRDQLIAAPERAARIAGTITFA